MWGQWWKRLTNEICDDWPITGLEMFIEVLDNYKGLYKGANNDFDSITNQLHCFSVDSKLTIRMIKREPNVLVGDQILHL